MNNFTENPTRPNTPTELKLKRTVAAPRQLAFDAWTQPKSFAQWWGPHNFISTIHEFDARVGGAIRLDMRGPNGIQHPMTGKFIEIDSPEKLVFSSAALNFAGNAIFENLNTVVFTEVEGGTEIALHVRILSQTAAAEPYLQGMELGWSQSLERLTEWLQAM